MRISLVYKKLLHVITKTKQARVIVLLSPKRQDRAARFLAEKVHTRIKHSSLHSCDASCYLLARYLGCIPLGLGRPLKQIHHFTLATYIHCDVANFDEFSLQIRILPAFGARECQFDHSLVLDVKSNRCR